MKKLNVFGVFKSLIVTMVVFLAIFVSAIDAKADYVLFNNFNGGAVGSGGSSPSFGVSHNLWIISIMDYHYFSGGAPPGSIGLDNISSSPPIHIGTWAAHDGYPPEPGTYWISNPYVLLTPGTYQIIDSNPGTVSSNIYSNWYFMSQVIATDTPPPPVPLPGAVWLLGSGLLGLVGWRRFRKE